MLLMRDSAIWHELREERPRQCRTDPILPLKPIIRKTLGELPFSIIVSTNLSYLAERVRTWRIASI